MDSFKLAWEKKKANNQPTPAILPIVRISKYKAKFKVRNSLSEMYHIKHTERLELQSHLPPFLCQLKQIHNI